MPTTSKICNIIHNKNGKFFCFSLPASKQELPITVMYNLKDVCPRLDRYWMYDYIQKLTKKQKNNMTGSDIYVDLNRKPKIKNDPYSRMMEDSSS
jgi:hypothetical protein